MKNIQSIIQAVWGAALFAMGIAFFFQIPDIMSRISEIPYFQKLLLFVRGCLYVMSIMLIGGGMQKLMSLKKMK